MQLGTQIIYGKSENFKVGFTVREYMGFEILKNPVDPTDITNAVPITDKDGMIDGDAVFMFAGAGYAPATIKQMGDSAWKAETENWLGFLAFAEDDRKCWVVVGSTCKSALARVDFK